VNLLLMNVFQANRLTKENLWGGEKFLRPDLNFGSHWDQLPYLINFCVRHGDASIRPVGLAVQRSQIGKRPG
jgi:hypothetical protein